MSCSTTACRSDLCPTRAKSVSRLALDCGECHGYVLSARQSIMLSLVRSSTSVPEKMAEVWGGASCSGATNVVSAVLSALPCDDPHSMNNAGQITEDRQ